MNGMALEQCIREVANPKYAHTLEGRPPAEWHSLEEHLEQTAARAAEFASAFGCAGWGYLGGLWHDLGKYSDAFQTRLLGLSDPDAHVETRPGKVDHSTAGAIHAVRKLGDPGRVLAYIIAGHHAGLADWRGTGSALMDRLQKVHLLDEALAATPPTQLLERGLPTDRPKLPPDPALWIRMLFSCLVDADFLDTEGFMAPERSQLRAGYPSVADLAAVLEVKMKEILSSAPDTRVNQVRAEVLAQCRSAADRLPGVYSLTVPTGGGKTLSSMAFALRHAALHGKHRIIYVIPYTSIIEQTSGVFRKIFGDCVIEHHSSVDVPNESVETYRSRLACENWDAPIIVTTSVQFFESFFASRTSRCRKLHNVVDSVVIFDEAQLLPPDFLYPILRLLQELCRSYGVSVVLCTATQPALERRPGFNGLESVQEIVSDPIDLHRRLRRVRVELCDDLSGSMSWPDVAGMLRTHHSVLCIVNSRADCRTLWGLMPEGTIHLSALMCGAHRSNVIKQVRERLKLGLPTRVVSTQLVEAGVDLDFPVVYRAMAGLDSIAQAAGRCNREGMLESGLVRVFLAETLSPPGHPRQAAGVGLSILRDATQDVLGPDAFRRYFHELFWIKGNERLDSEGILKLLAADRELRFSFKTAAERFNMIADSGRPVLVRYGKGQDLLEEVIANGPNRALMRRLQRYIVNVPIGVIARLSGTGEIVEVAATPGLFAQVSDWLYGEIGLGESGMVGCDPEDMII